MPFTNIQIINKAFSNLGHTVFIASLTETSNERNVAVAHYDPALQYVLEDFSWGFATGYEELGLVEADPNTDWQFSYRYPTECVTVRRILRASVKRQDPNPPPFTTGQDAQGRLIYTDEQDAVVEITKLITDTALFTAMFVEAFSWWLAFLMAPGLAKDRKIAGDCFTVYNRVLQRAAAKDLNESQRPPELESEAIRARD